MLRAVSTSDQTRPRYIAEKLLTISFALVLEEPTHRGRAEDTQARRPVRSILKFRMAKFLVHGLTRSLAVCEFKILKVVHLSKREVQHASER